MSDHDPYAFSAGYYDLFAARPDALPSIEFFAGLAQPGCHALEVGAGTGRVALAVAEKAASVYCLERSATMRAVLMAKLAARPDLQKKVTVLPGAAPDFELGRQFGFVYLAGVLEHIPQDARPGLFATLAGHVEDGGTLALDMVLDDPVPDFPEEVQGDVTVGDLRIELSCAIKPETEDRARLRFVYRSYLGGELVSVEEIERDHMMHRPAGVLADLAAAGFEPVGGGAVRGQAAGPGDRADQGAVIAVRRAG